MEWTIVFIVLWLITLIFLGSWVRNLINKIKETAQDRNDTIKKLYAYIDKLDEISMHDMWSGEPMFREFKIHTERLIRYLQTDQMHEGIKFLYEEEK